MTLPPASSAGTEHDDWRPSATLEMLRLRSRMRGWLREFFAAHGYWEVDTPVLSHDVTVDAWLEPLTTRCRLPASHADRPEPAGDLLYLQTSPEFAMKRLLAAGANAIYQLGPAFRNSETGRWHNPEFCLLEWYRTGCDHHRQMQFTEQFVTAFLQECRSETGLASPPAQPFPRLTWDEACQQALGTPLLHMPPAGLADVATRTLPPGFPDCGSDRDAWLNLLLAECVEPHLATFPAVFLYDYPHTQAALARVRNDSPPVAERFELYLGGLEICNGYHELLDAAELQDRNRRQNAVRVREGHPALPEESRLLEAMRAGLPPASGVALGFDRLLAVATGSGSLAEVLPFPVSRC